MDIETLTRLFVIARDRGDRIAALNIRARIRALVPAGAWNDFWAQFFAV